MKKETRSRPSIDAHFAELPDPRIDRTRKHGLHDILVITICGVIGGADDWVSIERFAKAKRDWFETFLDLPHGIPSHDTFGRVFAALNPDALTKCFSTWIASLAKVTHGEVVAIDGKTIRRSFDTASSKAAIHMVSAWASQQRLVLGQVKTNEKSNEITAIPKLLELLELEGCIVTIDAMGCQTKIAAAIVDKGADYVFGLKGNQETLHDEVKTFFDWALKEKFKDIPHDFFETVDGEHGRIETRRYWCTSQVAWFADAQKWKGLRSFGLVESERTAGEKTSVERRVFIGSLPGDNAKLWAHAVRTHWTVENGLHWVLDMAFREDESRVRKDNSPQNLAIIRHIALNLLKQEATAKVGMKNKRLIAGWDESYLLRVLGVI